MFELEQKEYACEGIDWAFVDFPNNTEILKLLEQAKPPGVLKYVDDECLVPSGHDEALATKLYRAFGALKPTHGTHANAPFQAQAERSHAHFNAPAKIRHSDILTRVTLYVCGEPTILLNRP